MTTQPIAPHPDAHPEAGGSYVRQPDGALTPSAAATAQAQDTPADSKPDTTQE